METMDTLPHTPIDQSFVPHEEQMSVSDSSQGRHPQSSQQDFVFPVQKIKQYDKRIESFNLK